MGQQGDKSAQNTDIERIHFPDKKRIDRDVHKALPFSGREVMKMAKSIMQTEKVCYVTGSTENLHEHHIFFGKNRKNSEKYGCKVWLRADWHNASNYGVHFNPVFDLQLKQECQREFEKRYGHERFMTIFGRNYL